MIPNRRITIVKRMTLVGLLVLLVTGCVRSLHPIYTPRDTVFKKSLLGEWVTVDDEQTWELSRRGRKTYRLEVIDEEDRMARFNVRLTNIDDALFMDFYPIRKSSETPDFYGLQMLRVHTFARVDQTNPKLELSFVNFGWLDDYLKDNPDALAHERADKSIVLTASTDDLRKFLREHRQTKAAFAPSGVLEQVD